MTKALAPQQGGDLATADILADFFCGCTRRTAAQARRRFGATTATLLSMQKEKKFLEAMLSTQATV